MTAGGPPDFIRLGTHVAANQSWHQQLLEHPQITSPPAEAPTQHFFARFCAEEMREEDIARYHARFPRQPGKVVGESTALYLYDSWMFPLLRRVAPDARIIVVLRDPIERFRTTLAYRTAAVEQEDTAPFMTYAVHRGLYASHLQALLAFFPREQILPLQFERWHLDPLAEYRRTVSFLGADPDYVPRRYRRLARGKTGPIAPVRVLRALGLPEHVNLRRFTRAAPPLEPAELWPDLEASLHGVLDEEVIALREMVPDLDLALWPNFAHLAARAIPA